MFCLNSSYHKHWADLYSKVRGLFADKNLLIDRVTSDFHLYTNNTSAFCILYSNNEERSLRDLTKESALFMWYQLLIEILLRMPRDDQTDAKQDMLTVCRSHYRKNERQMSLIDEFDLTYSSSDAIKWYTRDCFLFRLLNKAFRTENIDLIYKFRFVIIDLYEQLKEVHADYIDFMGLEDIITVYRGQQLSNEELNKLKNNIGHLVSMNTFLSRSTKKTIAKMLAGNGFDRTGRESVPFQITINPTKVKHPFGRIDYVSYMKDENEMLFSMGIVFRIISVEEISGNNEHVWCIDLATVDLGDAEVETLFNFYKRYFEKASPLIIWAKFLSDMGEYQKSEYYYNIIVELLKKQEQNDRILGTLDNNIGVTYLYRNQMDAAFEYYMLGLNCKQKSLAEIHEQSMTPINHHLSIASSHQNIGHVLYCQNEYRLALECYEFALEIKRRFLDSHSVVIATTLSNTGILYSGLKQYSAALRHFNKTFVIFEERLPRKHPDKASLFEHLGDLYYNTKDYIRAKEYYEKTLEMSLATLPANHRSLAKIHKAFAKLFLDMKDYEKALEHFFTAADVLKLNLTFFHLK